ATPTNSVISPSRSECMSRRLPNISTTSHRRPKRANRSDRSSPIAFVEPAHEDRQPLAGVAPVAHLDRLDPFHPLEASATGSHESERKAVAVREALAVGVGRKQGVARLLDRQAPAIARHRPEGN